MSNKIYKKYAVNLDKSNHEIIIGRNIVTIISNFLTEKTSDKRVLIVIDEFFSGEILNSLLQELSKLGFVVHVYNFTAGKQHKNLNETIKMYEILESNDYARDSTMIAIGGGVIGDLAGFVASTYLRGMNFINVPTTLTAMIDSSIGGKVAINFRKTVNAIGNYYHPILNVVDFQFLNSLSERDIRSGMAEIIKCAIICDGELFDYLNTNEARIIQHEENALLRIFCRAIEIKLDHVRNDVQEQNIRLKLNYGHTLGHSVETSTGVFEEVYRHGEGVSIGMVGAAYIARGLFNCGDRVLQKHEEILEKYGLPIKVESSKYGFERTALLKECLRNIRKDKKRKGNKLRFILPLEIGRCEVYTDVPDELIEEAFHCLITE
ncbi:MAG: 3-dehydroquinate synthase [Candidatus Brocadiaceae bacterium]|nr:3-dehydroquinate synthase [Candidatus Brocadiaceae bacterium]